MAYFINPFHQSVCLYVYPHIVARQRLGKNFYSGIEYTRSNRRIESELQTSTMKG
jgi:hypothetical protein